MTQGPRFESSATAGSLVVGSPLAEGSPRRLSTARVLWLVTRLSLLRSVNRIGNLWRKRKQPEARSATARKAGGGKLLLGLMALIFAWQTVTTTALLVQRVSRLAEQERHPDVIVLDEISYRLVELASQDQLGADHVLSEEGQALLERAAEFKARGMSDEAVEARGQQIRERFAQQGLQAFVQSEIPEHRIWPSSALWYGEGDPLALLKPLAVVALCLALAQILQHVAGSDEDLARVGPGLEWLFSFPVPARALFLARACAAPFGSPLVWVVLLPFYSVIFMCSGLGWLGLPAAVLAAVYVGLLGGALRVLLETTLRRALPAIWVSRVQAVLVTFSLLPLAAGYALAFSPVTAGVLSWAAAQPDALLFEPLTLPLAWASGGARAGLGLGFGLGLLLLWLGGCVLVAERMVRDGVTTGAGDHVVQRGSPAGQVGRPALLRGVLLKEARSLVRDRRTRAQAFFAPLLVLGLQFVLNPSLARAITHNPRHAATAAFVVAAFSLTTSAFTALAAEGPALYWLYTAPLPLARALLDKLAVRAVVSMAYGLLVFGVAWLKTPAMIAESLPYALLALFGIALYSVIAVGIGTLGTDVLEPEPRRRVRPGGMYLFMLLAALFAHAIYTPSWWAKLVQVALSVLLSYAIWQKLEERLPFLLDPTEAPPPVISVADGVMAALAFFVLQSLFALPFDDGEHTPALAVLVAFVCAGTTVAVVALLTFRRNRVPDLLLALGLRRRPERRQGTLGPLGIGVGTGVLAAGVALTYLWLARQVPWLAQSFIDAQESLDALDHSGRMWMLALAVLAAPLFEEFIFRGILYRGFRRSLRAPVAALFSALVFALVHPAATAAPVFVMAALAAAAYERTGWLLTPVAAHMTYNAIVLGSALLR